MINGEVSCLTDSALMHTILLNTPTLLTSYLRMHLWQAFQVYPTWSKDTDNPL